MDKKIKIAIASDSSGLILKKTIVEYLKERADIESIDYDVESEQASQPFFVQASKVAESIQCGEAEKGILVCGNGQGMAIVANKHKGIYACVVDNIFSAERAKIVNNANVITLGGSITAPYLGTQIVDAWLSVNFTQKLESKKDFLTYAFSKVAELENRTMK